MRKLLASLCLTLSLLQAAPAQQTQGPNVSYTGYVESGGQSRAVVLAVESDSQYIVKAGDKLGDYSVVSLDADKLVLLSPDGERFELANAAAAGPAESAPITLRSSQAGLVYMVRAISGATGCSTFVCEGAEGVCEFSGGAKDEPDALSKLARFNLDLTSEIVERPSGRLWIIGQQNQIDAVEAALSASGHRGQGVMLDFILADLNAVLQVLAQEMELELVVEQEYEWGITVRTPEPMPGEDLLAMVVADTTLAYHIKGRKLFVGQPGWVSQHK